MDPVIKKVEKGYPAQVAGIEAGDRVVELNGKKIKTSDDLSLYVKMIFLEFFNNTLILSILFLFISLSSVFRKIFHRIYE